eukprot:3103275-Alexandrium_andersonii.AAC.2
MASPSQGIKRRAAVEDFSASGRFRFKQLPCLCTVPRRLSSGHAGHIVQPTRVSDSLRKERACQHSSTDAAIPPMDIAEKAAASQGGSESFRWCPRRVASNGFQ